MGGGGGDGRGLFLGGVTRIYYTLDKSNPTQSSTLYEDKITITEAVTIKAKAYADGHTASDVLTAEYTISG